MGGNQNPMLVEWVNCYLNKGHKIMTKEQDLVRVVTEAILLLLYTWNGALIPSTDPLRCFVALGCKFQFPIDFSANKHFELTSTPSTITSYSRELALRLSVLCDVASLLVKEQPAYHREFGFTPPMPFVVPAQILTTNDALCFNWPTLAELNKEILVKFGPANEDKIMDLGDSVVHIPGLYTGPPPSTPSCSILAAPLLNILAQRIINSANKLFFISRKTGFNVCKWRLVHDVLGMTTSTYPSCLKDGKYIVDFYTSHLAYFRYNAINQQFWLQYHTQEDLMGPSSSSDTHVIHPSNTLEAYTKRHRLLPFCWFVHLTYLDNYIHGPFDFATIHGHKGCNLVCSADWDILWSCTDMFHDPIPLVEVPTYSAHTNTCTHTTFHDKSLSFDISSHFDSESEYKQLYHWQKVSGTFVSPLLFFFFLVALWGWQSLSKPTPIAICDGILVLLPSMKFIHTKVQLSRTLHLLF